MCARYWNIIVSAWSAQCCATFFCPFFFSHGHLCIFQKKWGMDIQAVRLLCLVKIGLLHFGICMWGQSYFTLTRNCSADGRQSGPLSWEWLPLVILPVCHLWCMVIGLSRKDVKEVSSLDKRDATSRKATLPPLAISLEYSLFWGRVMYAHTSIKEWKLIPTATSIHIF